MGGIANDLDAIFNLVSLCSNEAELKDLVHLKLNSDIPRLLYTLKEYLLSFTAKHASHSPKLEYSNEVLEDLVENVLSDDSLDSIELDESKIVDKVLMEIEEDPPEEFENYSLLPSHFGPEFDWRTLS